MVVIEPQRYNFLSKSQPMPLKQYQEMGCYWTTKIQFSKQITTHIVEYRAVTLLLLNHKDTIF